MKASNCKFYEDDGVCGSISWGKIRDHPKAPYINPVEHWGSHVSSVICFVGFGNHDVVNLAEKRRREKIASIHDLALFYS